jgi:DNA-binding GntR family transcriptional regulator
VFRRVAKLRFSSVSGRGSVSQHDRIIALCEAGDVERAVAATRENWQTLIPLLEASVSGNAASGDDPNGTTSSE